jgi:hypothetical protein
MTTADELANGPIDDDDLRILAQVAELYDTIDPVPDGLLERIQFGITLDALHAEIAELQRDDALAGVRGDEVSARTVTFTSSSITTMVTITELSPGRARIDGWAAPGGGVDVELRTTDGSLRTTADADGRFVFDEVPRGLVQLTVRSPAGTSQPPVITPSIEI